MKAYCVHNLVTSELKVVPFFILVPNNYEYFVSCFLAFDPLVSHRYKFIFGKASTPRFFTYKFRIFNLETCQSKDMNVTLSGYFWKYEWVIY